MISPRAGSVTRYQKRAAITRSETRSVRTIEGDGTRYGLMTHSCTTKAIAPATTSVPTTSRTLRTRWRRTAPSRATAIQTSASTRAIARATPIGPRRKSSKPRLSRAAPPCDLPLLLAHARLLADLAPQVVELRAVDVADRGDLDLVDLRR